MNEESDTSNIDGVVQSTSMTSLNEEIAPKTDNKKSVFQRVGSLIGGKKSKDKTTAESEEDLVAQLTKERDRYKASDAEKKELITIMDCDAKLQSAEIEKLKAVMEYEAKLKAVQIENLKVIHANAKLEWKSRTNKIECDANSKAEKIECLQHELDSYVSRVTEIDDEMKSKSAENENFKRELDSLNEKLQASSAEIDRCKIELDSKADRIAAMDHEIQLKSAEIDSLKKSEAENKILIANMECDVKSKSGEIEKLEAKIDNEAKLKDAEIENLKIAQSKAEVESQLNKIDNENDANSKAKEIEYVQTKSEEETARSKLELDNVNPELDASRRDIDRYTKHEGQLNTRISVLKREVKNYRNIIHGFEIVKKKLMSLLDRATEMTIRWKFTDISKLTAEAVSSQPTEIAGVTWRIQVNKSDDHLAIYLEGTKSGTAKWWCVVLSEFQLLSQKDNTIVARKGLEDPFVYADELAFNAWGYDDIIPFEDLLKGDAVEDDSILVAVVFKVFPSS